MLVFYIVAGVVGAVFIVATIVMGGDVDADVDADISPDADVDVHVDTDIDAGVDHGDVHVDAGVFLPFLSFRFWTYFACFFGATGTVLKILGHGFVITLIFSVLVGLLTGWAAAYVMRRLATEQVSSGVESTDYVGLSAKVIVSVGGGKHGQVRCFVKGAYVDLMAESDTPKPIPAQSEVLIIEMNDAMAVVVPAPTKEEADAQAEQSDRQPESPDKAPSDTDSSSGD